jgi:hypothetical protein
LAVLESSLLDYVRRALRKRLVSPAFSDAEGYAEVATLKRSVRSSLKRC